jgi:ribonuclease HIII
MVYKMIENEKLLSEIHKTTKIRLANIGIKTSDLKYIAYGIQFVVLSGTSKGIIRIYVNNKGNIKHDFSQIKEDKLRYEIISALNEENSNVDSFISKLKPVFDNNNFEPIIGTDESGKGDYFGPLVTAGVFVNIASKPLLEKVGVRDSKKISDNKIIEIAASIKKICFNQYSVIEISPETYNKLYRKFKSEGKNLNTLLAWAHAKAIEEVLTRVECKNVLSDKFADEKYIIEKLQEKGKKINLRQEHKAESNVAVAAASILARERFLVKLKNISQEYGITLSKGASSLVIEQAQNLISKYGFEILNKIAKVHFKTTESLNPKRE